MLGKFPRNTIPNHRHLDIADMLFNQGKHRKDDIIIVDDASADENLTFPAGVTHQALYAFNDNGSNNLLSDYTLLAAPNSEKELAKSDPNTFRGNFSNEPGPAGDLTIDQVKLKLGLFGVTDSPIYGIEYNVTHAAPEVTRVGNMALHATLPIQSRMRRCLLDDAGNVNYYLDPNNSTLRDDGTPALLDGTHGQVMVEIPEYYVSYTTEGNINRVLISLLPFKNSQKVEKFYIGAYKAALNRKDNKLSSVVNTSVDYRGGNNNEADDNKPSSLLGKPATSISRINFDLYANNRGPRYKQINYEARKNIFWLITIEYATRQHQSPYSPELTPEGYKTGGLGTGFTDINSTEWLDFNGRYPLLNCGAMNSFGNRTGEKKIAINDFPTVGETRKTQINSYRGIENFFGDLFEITNGVNINVQAGIATGYIATGKKTSDIDFIGYKHAGKMAETSGYIKEITFGSNGDILPKDASGASSSTFFCDYFYLSTTDGLRGLFFGGSAFAGSSAGSACANSYTAPSTTFTYYGSRLCFF